MSFDFVSLSGVAAYLLPKPSEVQWPEGSPAPGAGLGNGRSLVSVAALRGYPCSGRDERAEGQDSTEVPAAAYLPPHRGRCASSSSLGIKRLKVCKGKFREM